MADIVFKYGEMAKTANDLRNTCADEYTAAANKFLTDFIETAKPWEGASKNKMIQFVTAAVNEYMGKAVPEMIKALADVLDSNAKQMKETDEAIAENIPSSLSSN